MNISGQAGPLAKPLPNNQQNGWRLLTPTFLMLWGRNWKQVIQSMTLSGSYAVSLAMNCGMHLCCGCCKQLNSCLVSRLVLLADICI